MEFSVIIPTYNRAGVLSRTLKALAHQEFPGESTRGGAQAAKSDSGSDFEVIVIDDGSVDDTPEIVERLAREYPVPLRYFRQSNRKQGAARNRGASEAQGRQLLFLGDDMVPAPAFLQEHARSHRRISDPKCVVIGYCPWPEEFRVTRFMGYVGEQGWQFGFSLIEDPQRVPFNYFYSSNLSLNRTFFLNSGGFDEDFREYGWEDIELGWRLKKSGMRLVYNPQAISYHFHPTSLAEFIERQKRVGRSAWTFYEKHPEMAEFLNLRQLPQYSRVARLRLYVLTWMCRLTETWQHPDLSRYYPDLMSFYYHVGILKARRKTGQR